MELFLDSIWGVAMGGYPWVCWALFPGLGFPLGGLRMEFFYQDCMGAGGGMGWLIPWGRVSLYRG